MPPRRGSAVSTARSEADAALVSPLVSRRLRSRRERELSFHQSGSSLHVSPSLMKRSQSRTHKLGDLTPDRRSSAQSSSQLSSSARQRAPLYQVAPPVTPVGAESAPHRLLSMTTTADTTPLSPHVAPALRDVFDQKGRGTRYPPSQSESSKPSTQAPHKQAPFADDAFVCAGGSSATAPRGQETTAAMVPAAYRMKDSFMSSMCSSDGPEPPTSTPLPPGRGRVSPSTTDAQESSAGSPRGPWSGWGFPPVGEREPHSGKDANANPQPGHATHDREPADTAPLRGCYLQMAGDTHDAGVSPTRSLRVSPSHAASAVGLAAPHRPGAAPAVTPQPPPDLRITRGQHGGCSISTAPVRPAPLRSLFAEDVPPCVQAPMNSPASPAQPAGAAGHARKTVGLYTLMSPSERADLRLGSPPGQHQRQRQQHASPGPAIGSPRASPPVQASELPQASLGTHTEASPQQSTLRPPDSPQRVLSSPQIQPSDPRGRLDVSLADALLDTCEGVDIDLHSSRAERSPSPRLPPTALSPPASAEAAALPTPEHLDASALSLTTVPFTPTKWSSLGFGAPDVPLSTPVAPALDADAAPESTGEPASGGRLAAKRYLQQELKWQLRRAHDVPAADGGRPRVPQRAPPQAPHARSPTPEPVLPHAAAPPPSPATAAAYRSDVTATLGASQDDVQACRLSGAEHARQRTATAPRRSPGQRLREVAAVRSSVQTYRLAGAPAEQTTQGPRGSSAPRVEVLRFSHASLASWDVTPGVSRYPSVPSMQSPSLHDGEGEGEGETTAEGVDLDVSTTPARPLLAPESPEAPVAAPNIDAEAPADFDRTVRQGQDDANTSADGPQTSDVDLSLHTKQRQLEEQWSEQRVRRYSHSRRRASLSSASGAVPPGVGPSASTTQQIPPVQGCGSSADSGPQEPQSAPTRSGSDKCVKWTGHDDLIVAESADGSDCGKDAAGDDDVKPDTPAAEVASAAATEGGAVHGQQVSKTWSVSSRSSSGSRTGGTGTATGEVSHHTQEDTTPRPPSVVSSPAAVSLGRGAGGDTLMARRRRGGPSFGSLHSRWSSTLSRVSDESGAPPAGVALGNRLLAELAHILNDGDPSRQAALVPPAAMEAHTPTAEPLLFDRAPASGDTLHCDHSRVTRGSSCGDSGHLPGLDVLDATQAQQTWAHAVALDDSASGLRIGVDALEFHEAEFRSMIAEAAWADRGRVAADALAHHEGVRRRAIAAAAAVECTLSLPERLHRHRVADRETHTRRGIEVQCLLAAEAATRRALTQREARGWLRLSERQARVSLVAEERVARVFACVALPHAQLAEGRGRDAVAAAEHAERGVLMGVAAGSLRTAHWAACVIQETSARMACIDEEHRARLHIREARHFVTSEIMQRAYFTDVEATTRERLARDFADTRRVDLCNAEERARVAIEGGASAGHPLHNQTHLLALRKLAREARRPWGASPVVRVTPDPRRVEAVYHLNAVNLAVNGTNDPSQPDAAYTDLRPRALFPTPGTAPPPSYGGGPPPRADVARDFYMWLGGAEAAAAGMAARPVRRAPPPPPPAAGGAPAASVWARREARAPVPVPLPTPAARGPTAASLLSSTGTMAPTHTAGGHGDTHRSVFARHVEGSPMVHDAKPPEAPPPAAAAAESSKEASGDTAATTTPRVAAIKAGAEEGRRVNDARALWQTSPPGRRKQREDWIRSPGFLQDMLPSPRGAAGGGISTDADALRGADAPHAANPAPFAPIESPEKPSKTEPAHDGRPPASRVPEIAASTPLGVVGPSAPHLEAASWPADTATGTFDDHERSTLSTSSSEGREGGGHADDDASSRSLGALTAALCREAGAISDLRVAEAVSEYARSEAAHSRSATLYSPSPVPHNTAGGVAGCPGVLPRRSVGFADDVAGSASPEAGAALLTAGANAAPVAAAPSLRTPQHARRRLQLEFTSPTVGDGAHSPPAGCAGDAAGAGALVSSSRSEGARSGSEEGSASEADAGQPPQHAHVRAASPVVSRYVAVPDPAARTAHDDIIDAIAREGCGGAWAGEPMHASGMRPPHTLAHARAALLAAADAEEVSGRAFVDDVAKAEGHTHGSSSSTERADVDPHREFLEHVGRVIDASVAADAMLSDGDAGSRASLPSSSASAAPATEHIVAPSTAARARGSSSTSASSASTASSADHGFDELSPLDDDIMHYTAPTHLRSTEDVIASALQTTAEPAARAEVGDSQPQPRLPSEIPRSPRSTLSSGTATFCKLEAMLGVERGREEERDASASASPQAAPRSRSRSATSASSTSPSGGRSASRSRSVSQSRSRSSGSSCHVLDSHLQSGASHRHGGGALVRTRPARRSSTTVNTECDDDSRTNDDEGRPPVWEGTDATADSVCPSAIDSSRTSSRDELYVSSGVYGGTYTRGYRLDEGDRVEVARPTSPPPRSPSPTHTRCSSHVYKRAQASYAHAATEHQQQQSARREGHDHSSQQARSPRGSRRRGPEGSLSPRRRGASASAVPVGERLYGLARAAAAARGGERGQRSRSPRAGSRGRSASASGGGVAYPAYQRTSTYAAEFQQRRTGCEGDAWRRVVGATLSHPNRADPVALYSVLAAPGDRAALLAHMEREARDAALASEEKEWLAVLQRHRACWRALHSPATASSLGCVIASQIVADTPAYDVGVVGVSPKRSASGSAARRRPPAHEDADGGRKEFLGRYERWKVEKDERERARKLPPQPQPSARKRVHTPRGMFHGQRGGDTSALAEFSVLQDAYRPRGTPSLGSTQTPLKSEADTPTTQTPSPPRAAAGRGASEESEFGAVGVGVYAGPALHPLWLRELDNEEASARALLRKREADVSAMFAVTSAMLVAKAAAPQAPPQPLDDTAFARGRAQPKADILSRIRRVVDP